MVVSWPRHRAKDRHHDDHHYGEDETQQRKHSGQDSDLESRAGHRQRHERKGGGSEDRTAHCEHRVEDDEYRPDRTASGAVRGHMGRP